LLLLLLLLFYNREKIRCVLLFCNKGKKEVGLVVAVVVVVL